MGGTEMTNFHIARYTEYGLHRTADFCTARDAADVACSWRRDGYRVELTASGTPGGEYRSEDIAVTTRAATEKAAAAAAKRLA